MSSEHEITFRRLLMEAKQSVTRPRLFVFHLLLGAEPQSMNELITRAKGSVDRVSVYRCIELFEQLGIARKVHIGWKYKIELSDKFADHHHHLVCLSCGETTDIADEAHIEDFITRLASLHQFNVKSHLFEIEGYCKNCQ